jgi:glycerol-3-phosphate dehydrogenase
VGLNTWKVMGTLVYWLMGRFFTQSPRYLTAGKIKSLENVVNTDKVNGGFEYSDAFLHDNDARFVFNFIRSSMSYGCIAANYVQANGSEKIDGEWKTKAKDVISGEEFEICSKIIINSAGPFVDPMNQVNLQTTEHHHLFSKGIHLIVDKITDSNKVLTFFADDGRLFFVIPMGPKTCIGTTDTQVEDPNAVVTDEDRQFFLDNVNQLLDLSKPLTQADIIAERCGVRPLAIKSKGGVADWIQLSRKHAIDTNKIDKYLSIFGGKLTDCINVGDEVAGLVKKLGITLPYENFKWYGEPNDTVRDEFFHRAQLIKLEDLLRRRSKISLVVRQEERQEERQEDILRAPGLKEACEILFGDEADAKL